MLVKLVHQVDQLLMFPVHLGDAEVITIVPCKEAHSAPFLSATLVNDGFSRGNGSSSELHE